MFVKLIVFVMLIAFAGLFFVKDPKGNPFLTVDEFIPSVPSMPSIPSLPEAADLLPVSNPESFTKSGLTTIYKWRDEDGVWQFSNRAADAGLEVETLQLDGNINIMPSLATALVSQAKAETTSVDASAISNLPSGMTTVAPEKIAEMMETVTNLQDTVDQRHKNLEAAIKQ
jgi:hypothetical protein